MFNEKLTRMQEALEYILRLSTKKVGNKKRGHYVSIVSIHIDRWHSLKAEAFFNENDYITYPLKSLKGEEELTIKFLKPCPSELYSANGISWSKFYNSFSADDKCYVEIEIISTWLKIRQMLRQG